MLQISSGKFYESTDRHISDGHGVFYSNYLWVAPIETKAGKFEPIDLRSAFTAYLFSYKNQMENSPGNILVRVGDGEILDQFQAIACFGIRAVFSEDRSWIAHACRARSVGAGDLRVPRAGGFNDQTAHKFFSGFLSMLADTLETDEPMQNIPLLLDAVETLAPIVKKETRRPMLALYAIFNKKVPLEFRRPNADQFLKSYQSELNAPHIESLAVDVFLADVFPWSLADCEKAFAAYLKVRGRNNRLVLPPRVETAITIALANGNGHDRESAAARRGSAQHTRKFRSATAGSRGKSERPRSQHPSRIAS